MRQLDVIFVTAAHHVKLPVSREKDSNRAGVGTWQIGSAGPAARRWSRAGAWCWACAAANKVEFTDARVPVAVLGVLVDMPEVHAIGGIDLCPRIIPPAGAASLRGDSRVHDGFSLRKVTWRVTGEASSVANRRDDRRVGSGITYD